MMTSIAALAVSRRKIIRHRVLTVLILLDKILIAPSGVPYMPAPHIPFPHCCDGDLPNALLACLTEARNDFQAYRPLFDRDRTLPQNRGSIFRDVVKRGLCQLAAVQPNLLRDERGSFFHRDIELRFHSVHSYSGGYKTYAGKNYLAEYINERQCTMPMLPGIPEAPPRQVAVLCYHLADGARLTLLRLAWPCTHDSENAITGWEHPYDLLTTSSYATPPEPIIITSPDPILRGGTSRRSDRSA